MAEARQVELWPTKDAGLIQKMKSGLVVSDIVPGRGSRLPAAGDPVVFVSISTGQEWKGTITEIDPESGWYSANIEEVL